MSRERYSQNKLCQQCREWKNKDAFNSIVHGIHTRKDRLCIACRDFRNQIMAMMETPGTGKCPVRAKELALIPNPFEKKQYVPMNTHPLLWTGNA